MNSSILWLNCSLGGKNGLFHRYHDKICDMKIVENISVAELTEMAERMYEPLVKGVVDIAMDKIDG